MDAVGSLLRGGYDLFTKPQQSPHWRLNVIKMGTICRGAIWPCFVPMALHQYIRGVDRDMYALELLAYRSRSENPEEFYDKEKGYTGGHWIFRRDLQTIYEGVHGKSE